MPAKVEMSIGSAMQFAAILRRQFLGRRLAGGRFPRGDVDLRRTMARNPAAIILPMPRDPPSPLRRGHPAKTDFEHALLPRVCAWFWLGDAASQDATLPLVGEGGRDAKHRGRVRGLSPQRRRLSSPSSGASRHLLPQGRRKKSASRLVRDLSRVDAPETVPHRGRSARGQHRQDARILIIAVERDRGSAVRWRRFRGTPMPAGSSTAVLVTARPRQREIPRAGGGGFVAIG